METFLKEQLSPTTSLYPLEIQAIPPDDAKNLLSLLGTICDPTTEVKEVWS
jgi:hypothetical protein